MTTRLTRTAMAVLVGATAMIATPVRAQDRGAAVLVQARDSIDQGFFDPALSLIASVLDSRPAPPASVRLRAHLLRGVTLLLLGGRDSVAVESFRQALLIDPSVKVDSLQSLSNQLMRVFEAARSQLAASAARARQGRLEIRGLPENGAQLFVDDTAWAAPARQVSPGWQRIAVVADGYLPYRDSVLVDSGRAVVKQVTLARPPLDLTLQVPADTTVPARDPRLGVGAEPSRPARVVLALVAADGAVVQADTATVTGRGMLTLSLSGQDGGRVRVGRYTLTARAVDAWGVSSPSVERAVAITLATVDTVPTPQPPPISSFLPETVRTHPGSAAPAIGGVLLAALTAAVPTLLRNRELGSSATRSGVAYAVGGTIGVAGIVGFLSGTEPRSSAENIRRNAQRRADYVRSLQETARANALRRAEAPIRIRAEGSTP
jgi:hypothetical protein